MKSHRTCLPFLAFPVLLLCLLISGCGGSPEPTPVPTSPAPPSGTPTPATPITTPMPTPSMAAPGCTNLASLVGHVTIPDDTILAPGESFVKTWRLLNNGTCAWSSEYALFFVEGDHLGGPGAVLLPEEVSPGGTIDLSVSLTAPTSPGSYEGLWLLRSATGVVFGIGVYPNDTIPVRIVVETSETPPPASTPTPPTESWRGEYFANRDLVGAPAVVHNDSEINFDWATNAPRPEVPADDFSVRWTRRLRFEQGLYRFRAIVDDGMRLYVDNVLIIDEWRDGSRREVTAEHRLTAGDHSLRIEYYDLGGEAIIQLSWDRLGPYEDWHGEYYGNRDLIGAPVLVRDDPQIEFDWGLGAPDPDMPVDSFSIRWTRSLEFDEAPYRFRLRVDDGARVYVDNRLLIDSWRDGPFREETVEYDMTAGSHNLRVEYYESSGNAGIQFWWVQVDRDFPDWKGEYWSNPTMSGYPALTQNEGTIDFDWGPGSAAAGLPTDNWSARWTRRAYFAAGTYRFHVTVDDGARLYVDDELVIDEWRDGNAREVSADYALSSGEHRLRVEFYDRGGNAQMRLRWERLSSPGYTEWKGQYWSNEELSGNPLVVRNDTAIDFDWGNSAPAAGVPADRFSARWERTLTFPADLYTFYAQADNGLRFYLDGLLLIDAWFSNGKEVLTAQHTLDGAHHLVVEYHEGGGAALAKFWWTAANPIAPKPTPGPLPPDDRRFPMWKGEYWANMELQGNPTIVRYDSTINFDWGHGAPAPDVPADRFSVRWEQWLTFKSDVYLFLAQADNGIRFYLDGQLLIDAWQSNGKDVFTVERTLSGMHQIVIEYYESGGAALVKFWWSPVRGSVSSPDQPKRK